MFIQMDIYYIINLLVILLYSFNIHNYLNIIMNFNPNSLRLLFLI